jgi:hypothetical protein
LPPGRWQIPGVYFKSRTKAMNFPTGCLLKAIPLKAWQKNSSPLCKRPEISAKVFISRDIIEQSYFRKALEKHKIEIEARSLIRTVPVITKL